MAVLLDRQYTPPEWRDGSPSHKTAEAMNLRFSQEQFNRYNPSYYSPEGSSSSPGTSGGEYNSPGGEGGSHYYYPPVSASAGGAGEGSPARSWFSYQPTAHNAAEHSPQQVEEQQGSGSRRGKGRRDGDSSANASLRNPSTRGGSGAGAAVPIGGGSGSGGSAKEVALQEVLAQLRGLVKEESSKGEQDAGGVNHWRARCIAQAAQALEAAMKAPDAPEGSATTANGGQLQEPQQQSAGGSPGTGAKARAYVPVAPGDGVAFISVGGRRTQGSVGGAPVSTGLPIPPPGPAAVLPHVLSPPVMSGLPKVLTTAAAAAGMGGRKMPEGAATAAGAGVNGSWQNKISSKAPILMGDGDQLAPSLSGAWRIAAGVHPGSGSYSQAGSLPSTPNSAKAAIAEALGRHVGKGASSSSGGGGRMKGSRAGWDDKKGAPAVSGLQPTLSAAMTAALALSSDMTTEGFLQSLAAAAQQETSAAAAARFGMDPLRAYYMATEHPMSGAQGQGYSKMFAGKSKPGLDAWQHEGVKGSALPDAFDLQAFLQAAAAAVAATAAGSPRAATAAAAVPGCNPGDVTAAEGFVAWPQPHVQAEAAAETSGGIVDQGSFGAISSNAGGSVTSDGGALATKERRYSVAQLLNARARGGSGSAAGSPTISRGGSQQVSALLPRPSAAAQQSAASQQQQEAAAAGPEANSGELDRSGLPVGNSPLPACDSSASVAADGLMLLQSYLGEQVAVSKAALESMSRPYELLESPRGSRLGAAGAAAARKNKLAAEQQQQQGPGQGHSIVVVMPPSPSTAAAATGDDSGEQSSGSTSTAVARMLSGPLKGAEVPAAGAAVAREAGQAGLSDEQVLAEQVKALIKDKSLSPEEKAAAVASLFRRNSHHEDDG